VLAGDIDTTWRGLAQFRAWPVPVYFLPGNHEFDGRELRSAELELRALCEHFGFRWLHETEHLHTSASGRRIRLLGSTRWCDFGLLGPDMQVKARRAANFYLKKMAARLGDEALGSDNLQTYALACRQWLLETLSRPVLADATVVVTHYAPSARSADPRYGLQPSSASFCNADDNLLPWADLWIHGHLHCRHDYTVLHPDAVHPPSRERTRVVCHARGHSKKGEPQGYDGLHCVEV
jgi:DNA repair exonuclease SbcCD nuclease subunit